MVEKKNYVILLSNNKEYGHYSGSSPKKTAIKAAGYYFKKDKKLTSVVIRLRRITPGRGHNDVFKYEVSIKKLKTPKIIKHKDGTKYEIKYEKTARQIGDKISGKKMEGGCDMTFDGGAKRKKRASTKKKSATKKKTSTKKRKTSVKRKSKSKSKK